MHAHSDRLAMLNDSVHHQGGLVLMGHQPAQCLLQPTLLRNPVPVPHIHWQHQLCCLYLRHLPANTPPHQFGHNAAVRRCRATKLRIPLKSVGLG